MKHPPTVFEYANAMKPALEKLGLKVYMEPGRSIWQMQGYD